MRERELPIQRQGAEAAPRGAEFHLSVDDWDLIRESVDDYLRSFTEADYTWWEPDDDRPWRLSALLDKLSGGPAEADGPK